MSLHPQAAFIVRCGEKTGNRKKKCVRSVPEPCSSSKCLRLFPRGDNVQSFDKTVFNYQAEIRSTVRYHCMVLSKRFSTSSGEFSCEVKKCLPSTVEF